MTAAADRDPAGLPLADRRTTPVRAGDPPPAEDQVERWMTGLPGWALVTKDGVRRLERVFRVDDFAAALALAGRIGTLADAEDHHPALLVEYGRLTVTWWTHVTGGLSINDFVMAAKSSALAAGAERP